MAIVTRSGKGNALTHTELDANFTHLSGDGTYQFPSTKGTTKQVLRMNSGATALEFATVDTDEVPEGSTNEYFTNARADARIANATLQTLSNVVAPGGASDNGKLLMYRNDGGSINRYELVQFSTTDQLPEGSTNLYYTDAKVQAVSINNVVEDTTPQLGGTLDANSNTIDMGTNVLTDTNLGQFITAYGWGNHASAGYLTTVIEKSFSVQTSNFNAVSGARYGIDTSSNTVTATLPGSPSTGDAIFFADAGGNYATNKLTLGRNGNTIMGSASDMDVTTNNQSVGVFYNGATWRIY